MPTAHVEGIDLWYELTEPADGRADAPTLVLTHGFAGPYWGPGLDEFREHYRVLWYHVRGHGLSTVPDDPASYSLPQFARDLAALLDALEIERPYIAGVSMGGMISAQFACDYPERPRAVILCDTLCGNAPEADDSTARQSEGKLREIFRRMTSIVEKHGLEELVARENAYRRESDEHSRTRAATQDEQDAETARKLAHMTDRGYINAGRAIIEGPDLVPRLPSIAAPALVSCGEWDLFYPCAVRDASLLPNARMATIRRAAHSTPDYQPALWKRAVLEFMADLEAGRDVRGERQYSPAAGESAGAALKT